jgi:hypothetical protein
VHQHPTPDALHVPAGEVTVLQLPAEQDHALGGDVTSAQPAVSYVPAVVDPVHVPVHWLLALEHLPLGQSESATQRQPVRAALHAGTGERVVVHA